MKKSEKYLTPKQEKRETRNNEIISQFKTMSGSITAIYQTLADRWDLTTQQIRNIVKTK